MRLEGGASTIDSITNFFLLCSSLNMMIGKSLILVECSAYLAGKFNLLFSYFLTLFLSIFFSLFICSTLSTSSALSKDDSWLSKLLVRKIEPTKESHSRMLSDKEVIYALHTHNVRPDSKLQYLEN